MDCVVGGGQMGGRGGRFGFFFFNDTATTEIYTLSLHDALPILPARGAGPTRRGAGAPARRQCRTRRSPSLDDAGPALRRGSRRPAPRVREPARPARARARRERTAAARGAAAPVAEDGSRGAARGRYRARFQQ